MLPPRMTTVSPVLAAVRLASATAAMRPAIVPAMRETLLRIVSPDVAVPVKAMKDAMTAQ